MADRSFVQAIISHRVVAADIDHVCLLNIGANFIFTDLFELLRTDSIEHQK